MNPCPKCDQVKKYLDENNIKFEERDVMEDTEARKRVISHAQVSSAPVTEFGDGDRFVVGFSPSELEEAIREHGLDRKG